MKYLFSGETYECIRDDRGFRYISEQVSHHPPVTACHAAANNWTWWQDFRVKTKFWGKVHESVRCLVLVLPFSTGIVHSGKIHLLWFFSQWSFNLMDLCSSSFDCRTERKKFIVGTRSQLAFTISSGQKPPTAERYIWWNGQTFYFRVLQTV